MYIKTIIANLVWQPGISRSLYFSLLFTFRTIMTGLGYIQGDWKVYRDRTKQINLIEPVLEGVMQLFFQSVILYIVYGPGTSRIGSTF